MFMRKYFSALRVRWRFDFQVHVNDPCDQGLPLNVQRSSCVGPMLGQRRRQWPNIGPTEGIVSQLLLWRSIVGLTLGQRLRHWPNNKPMHANAWFNRIIELESYYVQVITTDDQW